jgi:ATP-dependent exoDNAse (exonuclease V) beta subunit
VKTPTPLADEAQRLRFIETQGKNISVIAPAGVGKTHTIVLRIVKIAQQPPEIAADRLSRLVVVTYSVRAAQEMQQRARAAIRAANVSPSVQRAFQQIFFGTIHSYCVRLLDRFGHYLGLPSPAMLLEDHDECWNRFLVRGLGPETEPSDDLRDIFHFFAPQKLYALGREISPGPVAKTGPPPLLEPGPLLGFPLAGVKHAGSRKSLEKALARVRLWHAAWGKGNRFHPLPKCPDTNQAEFVELWRTTFSPLHDWLREAAFAFGLGIAIAYADFRLSEALMTYNDQVRLALRLLDEPEVRRELAAERLSILLDEAQDTDPLQFQVLLRVAGVGAETAQTDDQSFCIVGDFQQAIYVPRSDLGFYRQTHDELIAGPRGAQSRFEVTFRCDRAIIDFVNEIFPKVLHGKDDQAPFFPLSARADAGEGRVARLPCPDEPEHAAGNKINAETRAGHEARFLAEELKRRGPAGVGATSWSQVAILCPRKKWLQQIAEELRNAKIPVQLHSSDETQKDLTPGAWLTALVWVTAHPEDAFEIAGVLREIFGVADDAMAIFTHGDGEKLRLDRSAAEIPLDPVLAGALRVLRELVARASALPVHRTLEEIIARTGLRERLRAIDDFEFEDADENLDKVLATILDHATKGATLAAVAQELRNGLAQACPEEEEIRDAVQLLTSYKAKGLEWQTVIVPFFFRDIGEKSTPYPRLVRGEEGREMIFRDAGDYATFKPFVDKRTRQQLQRLLYVVCTRARNTLILIDDRQLYDGQHKKGGWSAAELLGFPEGENRGTWEGLPESFGPSLAAKSDPEPAAKKSLETIFPPKSKKEVDAAVARAGEISRRTTPHALAQYAKADAEPEVETEFEEKPAPDNPGILYGTWWHEFTEGVPWEKPVEAWRTHFARAVRLAPEPERAAREWELFLASDLAVRLREPGLVIHRELPFLWPKSARECREGVMDLAIYAPEKSEWEVIDWKTNKSGGEELAEIYRGQIEAYVEALRGMLQMPVRGSLYITASGRWLPFG